ncbi:GAF domain-containing protein [Neptunitalea lumnitzerae]|nr:GAF domain-containing protein [Neptunitalea sp. Y10]
MKREEERLQKLINYRLSHDPSEEILNSLTEFVSTLFDTPISLITFIDGDTLLFTNCKGLEDNEVAYNDSFCKYTVLNPDEVFVIENARTHEQFKTNPHVAGNKRFQFYMGAALKSTAGEVYGTLCILDKEPKKISEREKKTFKLVAEKVMDYLNMKKRLEDNKKEIAESAESLIKLTSNVPLTIFQLRRKRDGTYRYDFISLGDYDNGFGSQLEELRERPEIGLSVVFEEHVDEFRNSLEKSYQELIEWCCEFKVHLTNGYAWYKTKATPEKLKNGDVVWYGYFEEITNQVIYEEAMERIAFDISHVLRKPVANLMVLSELILQEKNLKEDQLKEYTVFIREISNELNKFTHELNSVYEKKWNALVNGNDTCEE